ncbi:MAG: hypothetical protein WAW57_15335 [Lutibacter sp.]
MTAKDIANKSWELWNDYYKDGDKTSDEIIAELEADIKALILPVVGKSVKEKRIPTFKEYLEMHFVKTEESRYKCIYTKIVYSRDSAFKTYNQAFDIKP